MAFAVAFAVAVTTWPVFNRVAVARAYAPEPADDSEHVLADR